MKTGHNFPSMHGFSGSANPGAEMRPKIHGYKYGGHVEPHDHESHDSHPKHHDHGHDDKHGFHIHKGHK